MDHINTILNEIHEQLGLTASFEIQMKEEGGDISIKWQDEGGNKLRLSQDVSQKDMETKPLMEILSPLCDDIREILVAIQKERSEVFYRELMEGRIPMESCDV